MNAVKLARKNQTGRKKRKSFSGMGHLPGACDDLLVIMWWNSSFGVGLANAVNITVLAVFVYIVRLLIKALKKYIQK